MCCNKALKADYSVHFIYTYVAYVIEQIFAQIANLTVMPNLHHNGESINVLFIEIQLNRIR